MKHNKRILILVLFVFTIAPYPELFAQASDARQTIEQDTVKTRQAIINYLKSAQTRSAIKTRGAKPDIERIEPLRLAIPFDFDSAELTAEARRQLNELGEALRSPGLKGVSIFLAGHTDERGDERYNLELSRRRVNSAKSYLVAHFKIGPERISAVGYGESRPIIRGAHTEPEHAINRRVEITRADNGQNAHQNRELDPLGFQWGVFHIEKDGAIELIRQDGTSVLKSNDAYRIYLQPRSPCFVYIYQVDAEGNGAWLFPWHGLAHGNPLLSRDYWIPSRNDVFTLDNTVGTETIYIVASRNPVEDLEAFTNNVTTPSKVVTEKILTRGLGGVTKKPASKQGSEKVISITGSDRQQQIKGGLYTAVAPHEKLKKVEGDADKRLQGFGDFYVVLRFKHE